MVISTIQGNSVGHRKCKEDLKRISCSGGDERKTKAHIHKGQCLAGVPELYRSHICALVIQFILLHFDNVGLILFLGLHCIIWISKSESNLDIQHIYKTAIIMNTRARFFLLSLKDILLSVNVYRTLCTTLMKGKSHLTLVTIISSRCYNGLG